MRLVVRRHALLCDASTALGRPLHAAYDSVLNGNFLGVKGLHFRCANHLAFLRRMRLFQQRKGLRAAIVLLEPQPAVMLLAEFAGRHADAAPKCAREQILLTEASGPRDVGD